MAKYKAIAMKTVDNVATAVENLTAGTEVSFEVGGQKQTIVLKQDIPFGHKMAVRDIAKDEKIMKYGYPIGVAERDIQVGEHVHVHNIGGIRGRGDLPH